MGSVVKVSARPANDELTTDSSSEHQFRRDAANRSATSRLATVPIMFHSAPSWNVTSRAAIFYAGTR